jgi:DNA replication protein DnaC
VDDKTMRKIQLADYRPARPLDDPSQASQATTNRVADRMVAIESVTTPARSTQFEPCPLEWCDGSGWYKEARPAGHPNFGKLFACACRQQEAAKQTIQRRRDRLRHFAQEMGGELASSELDTYDLRRATSAKFRKLMETALTMCRSYAGRPEGWIYLYGPTGTGKSHLAAATARAIGRERDISLAYTSEPELLKYLREGWGQKGDDSTDARMTLLQEADLIVIDDIGTAHRGRSEAAWANSQLLELLMPRYQFSRLTILTSNLRLDDIDEPRIRSRIKGQTNVDQVGRLQCLLVENSDQREGGRK